MKFGSSPSKTVIDAWLASELNDTERNNHVNYLMSMTQKTIIDADFNFYIESILNAKAYTDVLNAMDEASSTISPNNVNEVLESFESTLYKIRPQSNQKKAEFHNLSTNVGDRIKTFHTVNTEDHGIPTPIGSLNEAIGGLKKSQLNVIAAPSGGGKSVFLLNFSDFAFMYGGNVVYVTIEMSYADCADRYHSMVSGFEAKRIAGKMLTPDEKAVFYYKLLEHQIVPESLPELKKMFRASHAELGIVPTEEEKRLYGNIANTKCVDRLVTRTASLQFKKNNLMIVDSPFGVTVPQLRANLKNISNKFPIDLVVIDYINIMGSGVKGLKDWEELKYISRALKQLAREFDTCVLTAAQLNPSKDGERLSQDDMRYSKAINENADNVIAFKRTEKDEMLGIIRLELIKHRHSEFKVIPIREKFGNMRLEEISASQ
jgi:replicative DNA helicase